MKTTSKKVLEVNLDVRRIHIRVRYDAMLTASRLKVLGHCNQAQCDCGHGIILDLVTELGQCEQEKEIQIYVFTNDQRVKQEHLVVQYGRQVESHIVPYIKFGS